VRRRDILKKLKAAAKERGEELVVIEGGNHTKVRIGNLSTIVPRHNEVNEFTARAILKDMEADS
jgi:mRNA interferase HicA